MIFENTMCSSNLQGTQVKETRGDNCTQVTCHSSWKGGRYLQETIPLGFDHCQLIAVKDEQIPDLTLGWSSSGPEALEGFKPLRSSITPSLETAISFMCRPIQKRELGVFIFIEHIRKLTIEFLCLFEVRLSNTLSILSFQGWNTLDVFYLTIDVPIEVSRVCLYITNQIIHI